MACPRYGETLLLVALVVDGRPFKGRCPLFVVLERRPQCLATVYPRRGPIGCSIAALPDQKLQPLENP
jgi:hypothetical protein